MILCLTYNNAFGYQDNIGPKGLYAYSSHHLISLKFSEELDSASALNRANYTMNDVQINNIILDPDQRTVHLSANGMDENKTYRISLSGIKDLFGNSQTNQILIIKKVKPAKLPLKINIGGEKVGDFLADKFWWYDDGDYGHMNGNHQSISDINIKNTTNDRVYQSSAERIAVYRVRVIPGIYDVTLMFSDNHYQSNSREFNVRIEGEERITNLDVSNQVGMYTALEKKVKYIPITDGILDIHFDLNLYGQGYGAAGPFLNGLVINRTEGLGLNPIELPQSFELGELYPNPFNNHLTIPLQSSINQKLTIDIVDILGRQVDLILNNQTITKSSNIQWNSNNLGTGIYFVRVTNENEFQMKKISLVK